MVETTKMVCGKLDAYDRGPEMMNASEGGSILKALEAVIEERKGRPAGSKSYVLSLCEGGVAAIGAKVTEEAGEVVEAAGEEGVTGREHLVKEAADVVFHLMVLLGYRGVGWSEVEGELGRRFGISGVDEKAARGGGQSSA